MTRVRGLVAVCHLAVGLLLGSNLLAIATVQAADAKDQKISSKMAKPLKATQEAVQKQEWDVALEKLKEAQAMEKKTPFEEFQIDEFLGYILIQQKKFNEAAPVYERTLNSGFLPEDQVDGRMKTVAQLYSQEKNYPKIIEWSRKYLEKHPDDEITSLLLAQSLYLTNDFKSAAEVTNGMVATAERAGKPPHQSSIDILVSSYAKLDNREGVTQALKKSVRYYPKKEHWENLLDLYGRQAQGDRVNLGFYRLMSDVGVIDRTADYAEMAQLAIDAGVPGEAEQVLQKAASEGKLKSDDKTEQGRYDRLVANAKKQAETDRAALPQLAKEAEKAPNGQADVALGQAYLSYGQVDQAIAALQRGIQKRQGVTDMDEAQVSLGIAQAKKGDKELARQAFSAVKADSKWGTLAELWSLRTYN